MRIAQVLAGSAHGGAENFFVRLVSGLQHYPALQQQAFIRPHPERVATLEQSGLTVSGFRFGGPLDLFGHLRYQQALNRFQPDIVMTWMNRATRLTPPGNYRLVARLGSYYNLKHYRHCDYWIGISRGICHYLTDNGMPADRVFHIPNFVHEAPVTPIPRDSYDTPADAPVILAAGRLHEKKGFDVLIRALAQIPEAILWLAGTGPEESSLKKLAAAEGVTGRIRFTGWCDNLAALLQTADLFVCPSRHEGLGSVVLEAWFNGCPVVATRAQGPEELIDGGKTGLLTPVDDIPALAEAINGLLNEPSRRESLASQARVRYDSEYSQAMILEQYRDLFETLMERQSGRR